MIILSRHSRNLATLEISPLSKSRHSRNLATLEILPHSKSRHTRNLATLEISPLSKSRHSRNLATLEISPHSKSRHSRNLAILEISPFSKSHHSRNLTTLEISPLSKLSPRLSNVSPLIEILPLSKSRHSRNLGGTLDLSRHSVKSRHSKSCQSQNLATLEISPLSKSRHSRRSRLYISKLARSRSSIPMSAPDHFRSCAKISKTRWHDIEWLAYLYHVPSIYLYIPQGEGEERVSQKMRHCYSSLQLTYTFKTCTKHYSSLQLTYTFKTHTKNNKNCEELALCAFYLYIVHFSCIHIWLRHIAWHMCIGACMYVYTTAASLTYLALSVHYS